MTGEDLKRGGWLAVVYFLVLEATSWLFRTTPGCLVNPQDYGAYYADHQECPTFHIFLIKFGTSILEVLGNPNWVIAIFTIVLAVSTIFLWFATRDAAKDGRRAANIAEAALTKLERPFVFVKWFKLDDEKDASGNIFQYRVSATLENSGRTPAIRLLYSFNCGHVSAENIDSFDFRDQYAPERAILGPSVTIHTPERILSAATMTEILKGSDRWFVWGWADYDDIFSDTVRHRLEFCCEIKGRVKSNGLTEVNFLPHDRFNATDDDCLRKPEPYKPA